MTQRRKRTPSKQTRPSPVRGATRWEGWQPRVVAALAFLGLALSSYLLYLYISGTSGAFCAAGSGCDIVRDSPHSRILGLPVSLIGVVGYAALLALSLWPLSPNRKRLLLYTLALAGFIYSVYLTYLELFVIKAICVYCVISAVIMTGILVVLLLKRPPVPNLSPGRLTLLSLSLIALVLAGAIIAPQSLTSEPVETGYAAELARHLTATGATMYGAWWCPHCADQKALFGDAFRYINYVECDPKGKNSNPRLCQEKNITGYPTWEINGRFYRGKFPLEALAEISGYGKK